MVPATSLSALVEGEKPAHDLTPKTEVLRAAPLAVKTLALGRYVALGAALAGLFVAATGIQPPGRETPGARNNGSARVKHTEEGVDVRWRQRHTKVYLDSSIEQLGGSARSAIKDAFSTWSMAEGMPEISFEHSHGAVLSAKPDGKNTVLVAPITVKGHEHDLAITLTYSDEETGNIVEADVIINAEYPFRTLKSQDDELASSGFEQDEQGATSSSSSNSQQLTVNAARASCTAVAQRASCEGNAYDLQNVVTHEVGHFFGLGEDMEDPAATMYYCTSRCETHKRVLTPSDAQIMTTLYSAVPEESTASTQAGCGGARLAPRGGLAESGWAAAFLTLLGLVRWRRRSA